MGYVVRDSNGKSWTVTSTTVSPELTRAHIHNWERRDTLNMWVAPAEREQVVIDAARAELARRYAMRGNAIATEHIREHLRRQHGKRPRRTFAQWLAVRAVKRPRIELLMQDAT